MDQLSIDRLSAGHAALAQGRWEEAREHFTQAQGGQEQPEALEGLAMAAWWLEDLATAFAAREHAYQLYHKRGDLRGAARVAPWLALDYLTVRGEPAIANGWLQRARRLLKDLDRSPEHGWLALYEGHIAMLLANDTATALRCGRETAEFGRALGIVDMQMIGVALEGLALVSEGVVTEGMHCLDEATTAAIGGEMSDLSLIGTACCYLIYACERVRDYARGAQWCERVMDFCERYRLRHVFVVCRTHYASMLMLQGGWSRAEAELSLAAAQLAESRPAMAIEAVVRLGELRRRQGRLDEAAQLFEQVPQHPLAQLGKGALALDKGDAVQAADSLHRFLRRIPASNRLERVSGLELLIRAKVGLGELEQAQTELVELQSIAHEINTAHLSGAASYAAGVLRAAAGEHETARIQLEDAVDLYERSGAPFEVACARVALAHVLRALGREGTASQELQTALEAFQAMGASYEASRVARDLGEAAAAPPAPATSQPSASLTAREVDVLRLVAQGLSNQEIAERLIISEHTVKRHIANLLAKLDLHSRAAAVAYGAAHGLL